MSEPTRVEQISGRPGGRRRARRPAGPPPPPERPARPVGPTGPPPRPERPISPHEVSSHGPRTRAQLRAALASPGAARQAYLLHEVLGPPLALRPPSDGRP